MAPNGVDFCFLVFLVSVGRQRLLPVHVRHTLDWSTLEGKLQASSTIHVCCVFLPAILNLNSFQNRQGL